VDGQPNEGLSTTTTRKAVVRKDEAIHPLSGSGLTWMVRFHMPKIWFLIVEHIRFDCIVFSLTYFFLPCNL
jgi:hypothetical protein